MTRQQEYLISEAVKNINLARKWLDMAMYYSEPALSEDEQARVREAYDIVCKAIDRVG